MEQNTNPDGSTQAVTTPKRKQSASLIPRNEADLLYQAFLVNKAWTLNPNINLIWMDQPDFETLIDTGVESFNLKNKSKGGRPILTTGLQKADDEIEDAIRAIKIYLAKKYKTVKAATPYYYKFGIEHVNDSYIYPGERSARLAALTQTISAILEEGFGTEEYGTAFWTAMKTKYTTLYNQSSDVDGTVSIKVSDKNQQLKMIRKVLKSLTCVLEGNYPDNYESTLRSWGYQK
ncbi:MAG: hypothetical protein Q8M15_08565 [Bacteroidota bacterium]|nr:hypothetical protein [Bacteroidota bacterium]